jgi:hypothetical protein
LHIADKNNNKNTTPTFIGLNKTTQISTIKEMINIQNLYNLTETRIINIHYITEKTGAARGNSAGNNKGLCYQKMHFSVTDENARALKYLDLRTSELLSEDGQIRPKHIAVDCDFNSIYEAPGSYVPEHCTSMMHSREKVTSPNC